MKVLFVCSGNYTQGAGTTIVNAQGDTLKKAGIELDYFTINGKGVIGYFQNALLLSKILRKQKYDVVHAHYSFSGFCALLAGSKRLVVSLMGSDAQQSKLLAFATRFCSKYWWNGTIVKSKEMSDKLGLKNAKIFPNGVDFEKFKPVDKVTAQQLVGFDATANNVIFVSNPGRIEKNVELAKAAVKAMNDDAVKLHTVYNIPHTEIVNYIYAADALILTSLWEGSPNVIKEALACNCPLVSVPVGDVAELIDGVSGCYLCTYDATDVAEKLNWALSFGKPTQGRKRLVELGLDSETVATNILNLYKSIIKRSKKGINYL